MGSSAGLWAQAQGRALKHCGMGGSSLGEGREVGGTSPGAVLPACSSLGLLGPHRQQSHGAHSLSLLCLTGLGLPQGTA